MAMQFLFKGKSNTKCFLKLFFLYLPQNNSSNKDGVSQKTEVTALTEAAKSKIHQVRAKRGDVGSVAFTLNWLWLPFDLQYKVRAYIQMKSSKACKREIKSVMNTAGNVSIL